MVFSGSIIPTPNKRFPFKVVVEAQVLCYTKEEAEDVLFKFKEVAK